MKKLLIYPTTRALRNKRDEFAGTQGFVPSLMSMGKFEQRAILLPDRVKVDSLKRILFLRDAASFDDFSQLKFDRDIIKFFTRSDSIFRFFEELTAEGISFEQLSRADAYAEFAQHLQILKRLFDNYHNILQAKALSDKAFIPLYYKINEGFISNYDQIEIYLEGYLSRFEIAILQEISKKTKLIIHYTTSRFNTKMQERFKEIGIELGNNLHTTFNLSDQKVLSSTQNSDTIDAKVYSVNERTEQIALAFTQIEEMTKSGIAPQDIVLILPDESFKEQFMLFDTHHNLNYAMGYDYRNEPKYKSLEAIYRYWQSFDLSQIEKLQRYGISPQELQRYDGQKSITIKDFFLFVDDMGLLDDRDEIQVAKDEFERVFSDNIITLKEWLFIWLKKLDKISIDDVRGGKITVMGVLETRGVAFDGVVIVDFNEGIVPASSAKDQFLNSQVRAFAGLPTRSDRESLQKQYYKRLLEQSKKSVIIYSTSDNKLPSKFLYELGLPDASEVVIQTNILYDQPSQITPPKDPVIDDFDAKAITWSASRLKTYLECKRKYYYRYIQKIPAKDDNEINEGAFLHRLLELLHQDRDSYSSSEEIEKEISILMDGLLGEDSSIKMRYQKMLWSDKLKGYAKAQAQHFKSGWRVIEKEREFISKIDGLNFKGRIDRIDQNGSKALVIDYKSGSTKDAQKSKNLDTLTEFQMSIYAHLLGDRYQNINFAFLKILEDGEIEEIKLLDEKNEQLHKVLDNLKTTKSFIATKSESLQPCRYCEYALMCGRGGYG